MKPDILKKALSKVHKRIVTPSPSLTCDQIKKLSSRDKLSDYLPWLIFNEKEYLFLNQDNTIGFIWECQPLTFCGMEQIKAFESLLKQNYPKGSVMQWILYADHNVEPFLNAFLANKKRDDILAIKSAQEYASFLRASTQGMSQAKGIPVRNFRLFVTLKSPEDIDLDDLAVIEEILQGAGLFPKRWHARDLLLWSRQFFNGLDQTNNSYDPKLPLSKQIICADTHFNFKTSPVQWGKRFARCITPKTTGNYIDPLKTNRLFGGIMGLVDDTAQITTPFMYTLNILFDDTSLDIHHKASLTMSMRAAGSFAKALQRRLEEFGWALDKLATQERFIKVIPSLWIWADSEEALRKSSARVGRIWENAGEFVIQTETILNQVLFIASLPFGLYNLPGNIQNIDRHFILPTSSIARWLPCQGDFRGSSNPVLGFVGRKGQVVGIDLFDKRANAHNFLVAAETGAGKSFFLNFLCSNYYAAGAKIRIVDIGYSYKKLALTTNGRFLDFGADKICINPFDFSANDEEDTLRAIDAAINVVAEMAYSASGSAMAETEWSLIKEAAYWMIAEGQEEKGIDAICKYLKTYPKLSPDKQGLPTSIVEQAHRLAFNLKDFTSQGKYGRFFNGPSTFDISQDDLVVIELEGLRTKAELFGVVVMQIMNSVTQDLYLSDRATPRFILFEEAASLLKKQGQKDLSRLGNMIEEGYRRARKYQGAFGVVLQSLLDLEAFGPIGDVIKANATFKFLLEGKTYQDAVKKGIIDYQGLTFDLLTSVKNNKPHYAEFFIDSPFGLGVARLAVDPWTYWINTSSGDEVYLFESLLKKGHTPYEVIQKLSGVK